MKPRSIPLISLIAALVLAFLLPAEAGKLRRLLYLNYSGVNITNLYTTNLFGTVTFPELPDQADFLPPVPAFPPFNTESLLAGIGDNYGGMIEGYLTAPETGNYTFWLSSDDEGQFFMNTDSSDPLNPSKTNLICWVPGYSGTREWTKFPEQQSVPVALQAGKTYYLKILQKEGAGGDYVVLGWQTPSGLLQRPMPAWHFQPIRDTRWGEMDAEIIVGQINPKVPGDPLLWDGNLAVLYANVNLPQPVTYQWFRDGNPVSGATQAYYILRANVSDSSQQWSIQATSGGTVYSGGPVGLFVNNDKPTVVSAGVLPLNPTALQVIFSEDVNPQSATNTAFYSLPGATILSATISSDLRTVTLRTSLLTPTQVYTLTIQNVQDMATPANTMDPATASFVIAEGAITFRSWGFYLPDNLDELRRWSHPYSTALAYVNDMFVGQTTATNTSYAWNLTPARDRFNGQMIGYLTPPETGFYKFAIASDDHSILYLGTSNLRASKREICNYNGSTGRWNTGAQLANQQSALIYLEAGKSYYFEAVHRDGTGGDGVSVFWQTPSGPPLPTINQSVQSSTEKFFIPGQYLSTYATPPVSGLISYRYWDTAPIDLGMLRTWSTNNSTAPSYTNDMFVEEQTITTSSYPWDLNPLTDRYMGQIIGYLTAPETGAYQFGIASDDHGVLYLGTTSQRSSKREICNYNGSTGRWNMGAQANQRSAVINLVAGQRYYIEAVWRDGTGGDGVTLAWYTPSMATAGAVWPPTPADNQGATTPYLIPAAYLSTIHTFGNVTLKTNLAATFTAAESTTPTLRVTADGLPPYLYQWYKAGSPIPGATNASYTLPYVRQTDQGVGFSVVVSNNFSSVTSVVAALTVTADVVKPMVASAGSLFKQVVAVRFSEAVTKATAEATANYQLRDSAGATVAVNSAVQDAADASQVTLQTGAMPETALMQLTVQNMADLSSAANVMNTQTVPFRANNFDALTRINSAQAFGAAAVGDQILMTAGGSDIWGNSDQCAFLSKTITGNFDYKVQGVFLPAVNAWSKMGPMARASLDGNSRNVFNVFTPVSPGANVFSAQVRTNTGGISDSSNDLASQLNPRVQGGVAARPTILPYPSWLRLQRIGNNIYYYYSANGTNWTFWTWYDSTASDEGALPATLQVGLALTSHDAARTVDAVMASFTAVNDGALFLALQPTNTTVPEGTTAVFTTAAGGRSPYLYQWRKNSVDIPNATNATLSLPRVSFCDNGAQMTCRVSNGYGETLTSAVAILTVTPDTTPPTVAFFTTPKINIATNEVKLLFSEWVDATSAQATINYQVFTFPGGAPVSVNGALLAADERTVTLSTGDMVPGTTYRVVVSNVKDLACNPNTLLANSTDYFFCSGTAPRFSQRADGYIIMEAENAQVNDFTGDGDMFQLQTTRGNYSGAGYMVVPNGSGGSTANGTAPNLYRDGARMVYHINFNRTGRHIIWIRGWNEGTVSGDDDSLFVGFNQTVGPDDPTGDYLVAMNAAPDDSGIAGWAGTDWSWRSDRYTGSDPITFTNSVVGLHRFVIWQREDGTLIDKIVIEAGTRAPASNTDAPAPCTSNSGRGDVETWDYVVAPPAAPTISISSPANGSTFPAGNVQVTATVAGASAILRVEFFEGTNLIGVATSAPYTVTWPNVTEGIYALTARVTDVLGNQVTSAVARVAEAGALTLTDVTTPGDPIVLTAGSSPAAESVTNFINNTTSKCLNYDAFDLGLPFTGPVGFVVTPSAGVSIVSKVRFYTANDAQERDPVNFVLEGSNDGATWSLITSNRLTLPAGRNAAGAAINPLTQNVWHVPFANTTKYASYRMQFFNVLNELTANSAQLAEVELLGTIIEPPKLTIGTGTGGTLVITASVPGTLQSSTNLASPIIWADEGPVTGTVIITPNPSVPEKFYRLRVP